MSGAVHHVVLGRPDHGVTRLALQLLGPADRRTTHRAIAGSGDVAALIAALPPAREAPAIHLHVTDALLGPVPAEAIAALAQGRRVALTFHDVPQELEGEARYARRLALYAQLAGLAELVIVSSAHERDALAAAGVAAGAVLALPIDARQVPARPEKEPTVGLLGWIYPGKGHDLLLRELAALERPATLIAIGGPAVGHDGIDDELAALAADLGVGFRATGYLDDGALLAAAAEVRVPVCAHRHVSASGTMGSWMAAGRRAIVADGAYARELAHRLDGALEVVAPEALGAAIAARLDDPVPTVLAHEVEIGPSTPRAAEAQRAVLADWAAGNSLAFVARQAAVVAPSSAASSSSAVNSSASA